MPNELLFSVRQEITKPPPAPLVLGRVLVTPYDRIRVYAACADAPAGSVEVTLGHIVVDQDSNVEWEYLLDSYVLAPQTSVNQAYDVPGVLLRIWALGTAIEDSLTVDVVIWGFRSGQGRPPQDPIKAPRDIGTLVMNAMREANIDVDPTPPDNGGKNGDPTPPSNGSNMVNAGAGVHIKLGGHDVGETDDNGMLRVDRLEGVYTVEAERYNLIGEATGDIAAGRETTVEVILRPFEPSHAG